MEAAMATGLSSGAAASIAKGAAEYVEKAWLTGHAGNQNQTIFDDIVQRGTEEATNVLFKDVILIDLQAKSGQMDCVVHPQLTAYLLLLLEHRSMTAHSLMMIQRPYRTYGLTDEIATEKQWRTQQKNEPHRRPRITIT